MTAHSFNCPACGAPLLPRGAAPVISCPHCLTSVIVPEDLREQANAAQWETLLFDNFATNDNNWLTGSYSSDWFTLVNRVIADGRYRWEGEVRKDSSITTSWLGAYRVADFHLAVNCKHIQGNRANSSWGAIFRIQDNQNYYWFHITDSQFFAVSMNLGGQWSHVVDWTRSSAIKAMGNNQLEVIARGDHFLFLINGELVSEMTQGQFPQGVVGLAMEGYTAGEKIVFDFLDFTLRGPDR